MKYVIIRLNRQNWEYQAWATMTDCSKYLGIPKYTLARKKLPFYYDGWYYIKLKINRNYENRENEQ